MLIHMRSIAIAAVLTSVASGAFADTTLIRGGPVQSITIVRGSDAISTQSATFVDLPGAAAQVRVPAGSLVTARFSAESLCQGPAASSFCSVQIVAVKGSSTTVLAPNSGADFAFDSGTSTDFWESHSMDRSVVLGEPGKYLIKVQYSALTTSNTLRLDDWSLTIETADAK